MTKLANLFAFALIDTIAMEFTERERGKLLALEGTNCADVV